MEDYTCLTCGEAIPPKVEGTRGRRRKYCSLPCRETAYYGKPVGTARKMGACAGCGVPLGEKLGSGPAKKWCTRQCQMKVFHAERKVTHPYAARCSVSFPECEYCGDLFAARTRREVRACRGVACQRQLKNDHTKSWMQAYRDENGMSYQNERYYEQRVRNNKKRLGLLVDGAEDFTYAEIFDRDGWVCQLCNLPVDSGLLWPHKMSKSLDHIVPVSKGGKHVKENVQLAHVSCNSTKGNSLDWEVMADGRSWNKAKAGRSAA